MIFYSKDQVGEAMIPVILDILYAFFLKYCEIFSISLLYNGFIHANFNSSRRFPAVISGSHNAFYPEISRFSICRYVYAVIAI